MAAVHELPKRLMIFTSPTELREIADRLEKKQKEVRLGDNNASHTWAGDNFEIQLVHEQQS